MLYSTHAAKGLRSDDLWKVELRSLYGGIAGLMPDARTTERIIYRNSFASNFYLIKYLLA